MQDSAIYGPQFEDPALGYTRADDMLLIIRERVCHLYSDNVM